MKNALLDQLEYFTSQGFIKCEGKFEDLEKLVSLSYLLFEAKEYIVALNKIDGESCLNNIHDCLLAKSLFNSFVLSYHKCFSQSDKRSKLDKKKVFSGLGENSALELLHNELSDIRNKHAAHNSSEGIDNCYVLSKELDKEFLLKPIYSLHIPKHDLHEYEALIDHVYRHVEHKIEEQCLRYEVKYGKVVRYNAS